jgi:hypothetical protein
MSRRPSTNGRGQQTRLVRGRGNIYREPLCVIDLAGTEQGLQGVVSRNDEAGEVDEELAADVEEDEEKVETGD